MLYKASKCISPALLLGVLVLSDNSLAQETPDPEPPQVIADQFNRGTPSRSAAGYQSTADSGDYKTAAEYLDLRNLRGEATELTGPELAKRFSVIINRANWIDVDELVDDPAGRLGDGFPDYRDSIGVVLHEGNPLRLFMQKVPRGDGESIWKVSNATVSTIPELYETYGYPDFVEDLRARLPDKTFLGFELFKWVLAVAAGALAYVTVFILALLVRRIFDDPDKPASRQVFRFLIVPFGLWAVVMAANTVAGSLGKGPTAEAIAKLSPIPTLITTWVIFAAINLWHTMFSNYLRKKNRESTIVLLRPVSNAVKLMVFVAAVLVYLNGLGINITTVLAGLGVGGIAVALALQKPLEDIFGAITLYSQQPVRVGDFCQVGTKTGTIEEIGLRTTFIRTLANTRIGVPNSKLAAAAIDNFSARRKILYRPTLRLRYDSKPNQVREVLGGVRDALENNDRVLFDHRVRFKDIGDDALKIEVFAYFDTTDWAEYLELAEDMNLQILEVVANAGTGLALPASTLKIEQDVATEVSQG